MTTPEQTVHRLGFKIPEAPAPVGAYVPCVRTGSLMFTAGQIPLQNGKLVATGSVPTDVPLETAQHAACIALGNALAALRNELGSLNGVARIVRLNVFVNSSPGFGDQAKVANAPSKLLQQIFGDAGTHTRCAIGVSALPLNAPVELDLVVEVSE